VKPIRVESFIDADTYICKPAGIAWLGPDNSVPGWAKTDAWEKVFLEILRGEHKASHIYHEEWWAWHSGKKVVCYDDYQWAAFERVVVMCHRSEMLRKRYEQRGEEYVPPWGK
jgi:hypothetical protein